MTASAQLYDTDFSAWAMRNAELLRAGRLSEADIDHISEELESMGKKERHELVNHLVIIVSPVQLPRAWQ